MSWSFYGIGKPAAVAKKAKDDLLRQNCSEPEETIKAKVLDIIETCLAAYPTDYAVSIKSSGSQSLSSAKPDTAVNSLTITIEPLYGFIE